MQWAQWLIWHLLSPVFTTNTITSPDRLFFILIVKITYFSGSRHSYNASASSSAVYSTSFLAVSVLVWDIFRLEYYTMIFVLLLLSSAVKRCPTSNVSRNVSYLTIIIISDHIWKLFIHIYKIIHSWAGYVKLSFCDYVPAHSQMKSYFYIHACPMDHAACEGWQYSYLPPTTVRQRFSDHF